MSVNRSLQHTEGKLDLYQTEVRNKDDSESSIVAQPHHHLQRDPSNDEGEFSPVQKVENLRDLLIGDGEEKRDRSPSLLGRNFETISKEAEVDSTSSRASSSKNYFPPAADLSAIQEELIEDDRSSKGHHPSPVQTGEQPQFFVSSSSSSGKSQREEPGMERKPSAAKIQEVARGILPGSASSNPPASSGSRGTGITCHCTIC